MTSQMKAFYVKRLLIARQDFLIRRSLSSVSRDVFPDIETKQLKRGSGGRSSFNGLIVTVFGGGGFVGRSVVNQLAKSGAQVIVPFRGDVNEVSRLKVCGDLGQIILRPFQLKDSESVFRCIRHSNCVINLIGKDTETNNFDFNQVHVQGIATIARISREVGIKRLVHVSSLNSNPNPEKHFLIGGSKWLKSKYWGERALRQEFPTATIIKCSDIVGEGDNFSQSFCLWQRRQLGKLPLINGGFGTFKSPVFIGDVARAIVNALTDETALGREFAARGPKTYEMRSLIEFIQRIIQKTPDDYFYVTNMKFAPLFILRVFLLSNPKWLRKYPLVSFEKIEREAVSDFCPKDLPTIESLGVSLTCIEEILEESLRHWRRLAYYGEEVGEFPALERPHAI